MAPNECRGGWVVAFANAAPNLYASNKNSNGNISGVLTAEDGSLDLCKGYNKITDGLSNTMILAEVAGGNDTWVLGKKVAGADTSPRNLATLKANPSENISRMATLQNYGHGWADYQFADYDFRGCYADGLYNHSSNPSSVFINGSNYNGASLYSFHPGGINILMCDGTVRFLSQNMSVVTLTSIWTANGGEPVGDF